MANTDKEKMLEAALKNIKKQYGDESIMILGDKPIKKVKSISSGSLLVDKALGIGGYPVGRVIEIYGPESSGKTTLALHAVAEVQKQGGIAAFIDAENALDPYYARNLGVDIESMVLSQPDSGEQALEICDTLVRSRAVDIIVIDSVAALVPQVELDGEMTDQTIGVQARLMSKALRKMAGVINQSDVIVIFINQLREKVGIMFGSPETTTGGRALKFYASVRIDIRKSDAIKNGTELVGTKSKVKIVKNKVAPPFKIAEIDIIYGKGISKVGEVIDLGVEYGVIVKSGAWYSYQGEKIGQGRENVKVYLEENPELHAEIERLVIEKNNQELEPVVEKTEEKK
ncbi:MAG: recombinase RecA [Mycoplasmatales bacterium]